MADIENRINAIMPSQPGRIINRFPNHVLYTVHDRSMVEQPDGSLVFYTVDTEEMEGKWGGNVRAEFYTNHFAPLESTFRYTLEYLLDDEEMEYPVVIAQWKTAPGEPTLALEWDEDFVRVKHRWTDDTPDPGTEHSASIGNYRHHRKISTKFVIEAKWSVTTAGFFKVWRNGQFVGEYNGKTTKEPAGVASFRFGIYSFNFPDLPNEVHARTLTVLDASLEDIT